MIGQTISHYQILEKLGEGGMGVVYRALDTHLERPVAIKVLRPEAVANPERQRRFVTEAKAASALNHPNILTIHDIDTAERTCFIVMEYVKGKTLDQLIGRKGLPLKETLKFAVQIADALAAAHGAGIVHRDLKPGNLMVTESGLVKVLDFGLAKLMEPVEVDAFGSTETLRPHTEEGTILGTVAYMSPEQAEGKKVDARSDIFSFGSVLYEMVTGRRAFQGETKLSTLSAILHQEPRPVSEVLPEAPRELERIIARCLRKDPERRFQAMPDLRVALLEVKEQSETGAAVEQPLGRKSPRRPRWWVAVSGVAVLLLVLAGAWFRSATREGPRQAPAPKVVPLTTFPGSEFDPALSPDGKMVAYIRDPENSQDRHDLYVQLIGAGEPLRLTSRSSDVHNPTWSPDGRHIAFQRSSENDVWEIFLIPALGGPERKLGTLTSFTGVNPSPMAWTPDGKSLALAEIDTQKVYYHLFLMPIDTGAKRRITAVATEDSEMFPAFSPDGQTLGFLGFPKGGPADLFVLPVAADGSAKGEARRVTFLESRMGGLDWTPDGHAVVFGRFDESSDLWRVPVKAPPGTASPERVAEAGDNACCPSAARQGGRLAYIRYVGEVDIWRVSTDTGRGKANLPTRLISSTREDRFASVSADGQKIAFVSNRSGSMELWICDAQGLNLVQLTQHGVAFYSRPAWSPDGRRIAFCGRQHGNEDIFVIDAQGGAPRQLTTETTNEGSPQWSRNGRWIYFISRRGESPQLRKMPSEGGAAQQVTRGGGWDPVESADSKFLYYRKVTGGLWRVPVGGGDEIQVLDRVGAWKWALSEKGIYLFTRKGGPGGAIEFFDLATQRRSQVVALPKGFSIRDLTVSPDGRWILYSGTERAESDIMLIENFR